METRGQAVEPASDHDSVRVVGQGIERRSSLREVLTRPVQVAAAQVPVAEVEV
jgi:hypothetical protein